jgi:cell division protein FtsB
MELLDHSSDTASDWQVVQPVLDEAIASLGHEDRDALLLRFFKNESLAGVGTSRGVSEDAAQKRVTRALEKLRGFLAQRGITTTAAALSAVLMANAVKAAPDGFAGALATGALAKAATAATVPFLKLFTMTNMKTAILLLTLTGGLAGLTVLELRSQRQLRDARDLAQQQAAEIDALRAANDQLAAQANELEQARRDSRDVLRLRGELARLQRTLADRSRTSQPAAAPLTNAPPDSTPVQIHVKVRFLAVPESSMTSEAWGGRTTGAALTGLLSYDQAETAAGYFEKLEGAKVIGQPSVVTLSGRQAKLTIGQSVPFGGAYTNLGLILDLVPTCPANSSTIDLNFNAVLRRLTDASVAKDGSLLTIEELSVTNSAHVPDGQTLIVGGRIPANGPWLSEDSASDTAQPRSLLILLTPTIIDAAGNRVYGAEESPSSGTSTNPPLTPAPLPGVFPGVVAAQPDQQ